LATSYLIPNALASSRKNFPQFAFLHVHEVCSPEEDFPMKPRIMYIEYKGDGLAGTAWIGRVTFSQTGKTIYYRKTAFQSLKGDYKANYFDVETGERYWISGCKKAGGDTLYPDTITIDEDVREEYWMTIRNKPECVAWTAFRSNGQYTKRCNSFKARKGAHSLPV
jgi:hypothetical protein